MSKAIVQDTLLWQRQSWHVNQWAQAVKKQNKTTNKPPPPKKKGKKETPTLLM